MDVRSSGRVPDAAVASGLRRKGDAIGVLVLDEKGKIGGGLLGTLHHKNLGLGEADRDRIGRELEGGKAAVVVLAPVPEASIVTSKLTDLGGTTEAHEVSDEALEEARTAAATDES